MVVGRIFYSINVSSGGVMFFFSGEEPILIHRLGEYGDGTAYFLYPWNRSLAVGYSHEGIVWDNVRVRRLQPEDRRAVLQACSQSMEMTGECELVVPSESERAALPALQWDGTRLDQWAEIRPYSVFDGLPKRLQFPGFDRQEQSIVFVTDHGRGYVPGEGWGEFLTLLNSPENHPVIGKGSEGVVYRVPWCGKEFALKIFDPEAQKRLTGSAAAKIMGMHFSRPNFLKRIGTAEHVVRAIRELPYLQFDIRAAADFAFGQDFHLMEYLPDAMSLAQLASSSGTRSPEAQRWLTSHGVSAAECEHACRVFEFISGLLGVRRTCTLWGLHQAYEDLSLGNVLATGLGADGRLQLVLIDQGVAPVSHERSGDPMFEMIDLCDRYFDACRWHEVVNKDLGFQEYFQKVGLNPFPDRASVLKLHGLG
jgi:hypothetical protein